MPKKRIEKPCQVNIRMNENQKLELENRAKKAGLKVPDYCLSVLFDLRPVWIWEEKTYISNKYKDKAGNPVKQKIKREVLKWERILNKEEYLDKDGNVMIQEELPKINE